MSDFEKVYSVKFKVDAALKNLDKLRKVVKDIEGNKLVKVFDGMERSLKKVDDQAKRTSKTINRGLGKRAERDLDNLSKSAKGAAKSVKNVGKAADFSSGKMEKMGRNMRRYVVLPLLAIGAASVKASLDINKSMANVSTLLDAPIEKVRELKGEVQNLSKDTGKSTTDLADGLYQTVSALGESAENMDQLKIAATAAVAGLAETSDAIGLLTAVGKGYNDTTKESLKRTSDLAFQTVKLGVTTFPELAASMGRVVPLAASLNTSQEELFGTMATLTGVTGNTSEVVTQLSSLYSDFLKPSEKMQNSLALINKENKEYNFQSVSMMVKTLGLQKSLALLGDTVDNDSDALAKMFKRKEGLLAAIPLLTTQSENYTNKLAAMEDAVGATDEAYRKQTEGINKQGHEWEKTKQRMIVFAQRVGDRLLPVLDKLFDHLEPVLELIENMDEETMDSVIALGKMAIQFTVILSVVSKLNILFGGMNSLMGASTAAINGVGAASAANATKVAGLMSKLQAANALMASFAVGYAIGTVINQQIEASDKRRLDQSNAAALAARADSSSLSSSSLTDIQRSQKNIESRLSGRGFDATEKSHLEVRKQSLEHRARGGGAIDEQQLADINLLLRTRNRADALADQMASGSGMFGAGGQTVGSGPLYSQSNQGAGATNFTGGQTTININGAQNPEATGKAVERALKKRDRDMAEDLKRETAQSGAAEQ